MSDQGDDVIDAGDEIKLQPLESDATPAAGADDAADQKLLRQLQGAAQDWRTVMANEVARAVAAERVACCAAVCPLCAEGIAYNAAAKCHGEMRRQECKAVGIRERMQQTQGTGPQQAQQA